MKKRSIPYLLSLLGLVVMVGCSLHRPQQPTLATPVPDAFEAGMAAGTAAVRPEKWWKAFDDPVLNDLMDRAFDANLDLAQAVARVEQSQALFRQRHADRFPAVGVDGSAGRSQRVENSGEVIGTSYSLSVAASFEVDLFNKLKSRTQSQQLLAAASQQDVYVIYLTLSARIADLYYLMVEQRAQLALIDKTVATRAENLDLVESNYREGLVSALDVYQARQVLASARTQRPTVAATLATTAHALAVLTGGYPTQNIGGQLAELPDIPAVFPTGLPSDVLKQRPDIQAALMRLQAADQDIGVAMADRFPSMNLFADYGLTGSDFGTSLSGTAWSLVANLTAPLLDWGKRKAEVERTRAAYREQLAGYQLAVLTAFQEVEDSLVDNRTAMESIQRIRSEVSAAEGSLRLSLARYRDGLSDYLPVLTAQATQFDSQIRLLSAQRQLISARISLSRALGGRWMQAVDQETEPSSS